MTNEELKAMRLAALAGAACAVSALYARWFEQQLEKASGDEPKRREALDASRSFMAGEAKAHAILAVELLASVPRASQEEFVTMNKALSIKP